MLSNVYTKDEILKELSSKGYFIDTYTLGTFFEQWKVEAIYEDEEGREFYDKNTLDLIMSNLFDTPKEQKEEDSEIMPTLESEAEPEEKTEEDETTQTTTQEVLQEPCENISQNNENEQEQTTTAQEIPLEPMETDSTEEETKDTEENQNAQENEQPLEEQIQDQTEQTEQNTELQQPEQEIEQQSENPVDNEQEQTQEQVEKELELQQDQPEQEQVEQVEQVEQDQTEQTEQTEQNTELQQPEQEIEQTQTQAVEQTQDIANLEEQDLVEAAKKIQSEINPEMVKETEINHVPQPIEDQEDIDDMSLISDSFEAQEKFREYVLSQMAQSAPEVAPKNEFKLDISERTLNMVARALAKKVARYVNSMFGAEAKTQAQFDELLEKSKYLEQKVQALEEQNKKLRMLLTESNRNLNSYKPGPFGLYKKVPPKR